MAKFQPKIYSLSTLNVRQHFNCDYRFHDFRTDFSGESGSGKSLIADFIQLLLVGSRFFKSGTEGVKHRDTSGLVLKSVGGKYGRGFIFINIEVQPRKYIALGGYLETTSSQMQFFIIQAGYDFEETLVPMNEPIFYRDLLLDGNIDTLENLEKSFLEKGYIKGVSNKKYHYLLFNNGMLSVDLSQNAQSLKSYAAIIRSFSRGKGFFTDSDALKTFLFGDDDQKQLIDKYREEVQNITLDHQQHQRLLEEIAMIKSKEQKIERVLRDFKDYQQSKMQFSLENVCFWFQENTQLRGELEKLKQIHQVSHAKKSLVGKRLANNKIADIKIHRQSLIQLKSDSSQSGQEKEKLEAETRRTKKLFDESTKYKDTIDKVGNWFAEERQDIEAIRQWHLAERTKVQNTELLKAFEIFLKEHKLQQDFEQSDWYKDYATAGKLASQKLDDLREVIAKQETQLLFSDLDNQASLAHWAIANLDLPLTLEQESLLIHFQSLSRTVPVPPKERYLPFPEKLFKNPTTVKTSHEGFWLELNGIYEFIQKVTKQHLNVPPNQIKLDREPLAVLKQELEILKLNHERLNTLKGKLESYPALEKVVSLYKAGKNKLFTEIDEIAQLTTSELEKHLAVFQNSEQHITAYESYKAAYDIAYAKDALSQQADRDTIDKIKQVESYMANHYGPIEFDQLLNDEERRLRSFDSTLEEFILTKAVSLQRIQRLEDELFKTVPSLTKLYEMATEMDAQCNESKKQLQQREERYNSSLSKLDEAKFKFMLEHNRDFVADLDIIKVEHQPDEKQSESANLKFIAAYDLASEEIEDKTILKDYSVGVLAHKLLPTVFPTQQIQEELIGEQIEKRLTELTNDLQRIGSRKIEILHNVFNEVQRVYNEYLTRVQRITKYLSSNEITGGNYASLQHKPSLGYPDDWMKIFRKRLTNEMQDVGLFSSSNKQDIDEIMISVFREANGTKDATVNDLLNPRSYFDLLFRNKVRDGQSNSGSNGQTYTANALLCLARLSLIEDKDRSGIRVMPIDEAEGLGSNYEMLHALAQKENYQIITMSIETAGNVNEDGQYIYIMHDNKDATGLTYVPPLGIFHKGQLTDNINEIFEKNHIIQTSTGLC